MNVLARILARCYKGNRETTPLAVDLTMVRRVFSEAMTFE